MEQVAPEVSSTTHDSIVPSSPDVASEVQTPIDQAVVEQVSEKDSSADQTPVEQAKIEADVPVEPKPVEIIPVRKLHIVDGNCNFIGDVDNYYQEIGMADAGLNYHTLTIFGSQSTGKSTLLNDLFGTTFEMMDASRGPKQTTHGIWLSKSDRANVLVFDVEGTDSGERGENSLIERRTSLFSIAVAEVVLINMFTSNVDGSAIVTEPPDVLGTYHGANIGLLKNIFEVNLQVFAINSTISKTTIIVLLRDYFDYMNIDHLRARISTQVTDLWSKIVKPEGFEELKFEDFFNLVVIELPSKMVFRDQFMERVASLRERFVNPSSEGYVFPSSNAKAVPITDFGGYIHKIWDVICGNEDLDIPTEKELLATHRCNEIQEAIVKEFETAASGVLSQDLFVDSEQLVLELLAKVQHLSADYDKKCKYYIEGVKKKVRDHMMERLAEVYQGVFSAQLKVTAEASYNRFEATLKKKILHDQVTKDFLAIISSASKDAHADFQQAVTRLSSSLFKLNSSSVESLFHGRIESRMVQEKNHQLSLFAQDNQMDVDDAIATLRDVTETVSSGFWNKIKDRYEELCGKFRDSIPGRLQEFGASEEQIQKAVATTLKDLKNAVRQHLSHFMSPQEIVNKHFKFFHEKFNYSGSSVRIWDAQSNVKQIFDEAKDSTLKVYGEVIEVPNLPEIIYKTSFSATERESMLRQLESRMSESFQLAANQVALMNAQNKVPFWAVVAMSILGFDEMFWMLTNPIGFLFLMLLAAGAYFFFTMPPEIRDVMVQKGLAAGQAAIEGLINQLTKNKRD